MSPRHAHATGFPGTVADLVAAQVSRTPDRVAVSWHGGGSWTYAELQAKADAIAQALLQRDVSRGELVGVCVPRRPDMLAATLGVMRAGAAYVALDPAFPSERLHYMAQHAGMRHILTWREQDVPDVLKADAGLIELHNLDSNPAPRMALPELDGGDLAYVLYTSGSTGKPKGVRILQRNLVNFLTSMRQTPGIGADDILCAATTLSFDIAALELYLPLLVGAHIVIAGEAEQVDPVAFARMLRRHGVSMLQTTPTLLQLLLSSDRVHEVRGMKLLVGGEAMPRDLAETILPECGELWNMYGPTETTVWSTIHKVAHGSGSVPLGSPIANTSIHILDAARSAVAEGEVGEIWIGGAGVADGYLHDPEKTADCFLPDPFVTDGSPMYRTGDLGSLRDGVLYFHGRADDQIKLRGYRIEPGDIEAAALEVDGVRQAVAVAREVSEGDKRLLLYVTATADTALASRLRESLRTSLPAYMLPQHIEILDTLPRTPNGKIDRKALPLPRVFAVAAVESPSGVSSGQLQAAIATIWRDLLKVREVGPQDDFFDLGGDSLLAVRVFERMLAMTGVNLPLSTLLSAPTVAEQAAAFRAAGAREPDQLPIAAGPGEVKVDQWSPLVSIQPRGTRPPLFLIHAVGGNVLNYVPLGHGLGADQPVYGLQAIGLDGVTPPIGSIQTMAACYVTEIQRRQPQGPYYLGGGSMGGLIAFEVAQQLREQGETIGLLALMDTYGPDCPAIQPRTRQPILARVVQAMIYRPLRLFDAMRVRRARMAGQPLAHALRYREIHRVHYRALANYLVRAYDGDIVLFRGAEQPAASRDISDLGWSRYVRGGLEIIDLPGGHDTLIEQPKLLHGLREALKRAQAATSA